MRAAKSPGGNRPKAEPIGSMYNHARKHTRPIGPTPVMEFYCTSCSLTVTGT